MASALQGRVCYEFGHFRLDVNRRAIRSTADGRALRLEPRVFAAALYLVEHAGCVLSKERLLSELWPGSEVEENNLAQVISSLRRLLGETRGENRYIATVPRRGYCFVADVRLAGEEIEAWSPDACCVSVMPLELWSTLEDDVQLGAGVAESIRHHLTRTRGVRVASRPCRTDDGNRPAGCDSTRPRCTPRFQVEGSLQRAGACLRITVCLVDLADGSHTWSTLMDSTNQDVFLIEDEMARRVVDALTHLLSAESRTVSSEDVGAGQPASDRGQVSATG